MSSEIVEKRAFTRYSLWFPVSLFVSKGEGEPEVFGGICRDASAGGMQVSSERMVRAGTMIEAKFRVTPGARPDRRIQAEVVRAESNEGELVLAFPFRLALRFERPMPELPEELAAHATAKSSR